jgi:hypothetical protein
MKKGIVYKGHRLFFLRLHIRKSYLFRGHYLHVIDEENEALNKSHK